MELSFLGKYRLFFMKKDYLCTSLLYLMTLSSGKV